MNILIYNKFISELEEKMRKRKSELDGLSEDLAFGKRSNDIINRELDALPKSNIYLLIYLDI